MSAPSDDDRPGKQQRPPRRPAETELDLGLPDKIALLHDQATLESRETLPRIDVPSREELRAATDPELESRPTTLDVRTIRKVEEIVPEFRPEDFPPLSESVDDGPTLPESARPTLVVTRPTDLDAERRAFPLKPVLIAIAVIAAALAALYLLLR